MSQIIESLNSSTSSRGAHNQQVGRAGEHFVVAELNKRQTYAVTFAGNMPQIDVLACNHDQSRTIHIQVKTKRSGTWHASIYDGRITKSPPKPMDETVYRIFVDLGELNAPPQYWIVPDWWMRNDIYQAHKEWLDKHGGKRPRNPDSTHHAINEKRLSEWKDKWEILGIFEKLARG